MSELKAYIGPAPDEKGLADYYLKSEADKVIAELIKKNERLSDDCLIKASNTFREIEKEIRHHKYKRCLAMAEMCKARYDEEDAKLNRWGSSWDYVSEEMKYWERWQWRWEALAEEPTWAKFLQLIHKEAK